METFLNMTFTDFIDEQCRCIVLCFIVVVLIFPGVQCFNVKLAKL